MKVPRIYAKDRVSGQWIGIPNLGITGGNGEPIFIYPSVGENGNWWVNGEDTGYPSTGDDGKEVELRANDTHIQWEYTGTNEWHDLIALSALKGPQGKPGIQGEPGIPGTPGTNGTDGAPGRDGTPGRDGINGLDGYSPLATVSKTGDTTTITITDKNGVTTAQVKDGKDGKDGVNGTNGTNGKDGKDGAPGVKGDPFTYDDFTYDQLQDLKGPQGDPGKQGNPGPPGSPGEPGPSGAPGAQGEPGPRGYNGDDGKTPVLTTGIVSTGNPNTPAEAEVVRTGSDNSGNPKYRIDFTIPKGAPGSSSNIVVDDRISPTSINPVQNKVVYEELSHRAPEEHDIIVDESGNVSKFLPACDFYKFTGNLTSLNIEKGYEFKNSINIHAFQFHCGNTPVSLTFTGFNSLRWASTSATKKVSGIITPNIKANKSYEVTIINDLAVIGEF